MASFGEQIEASRVAHQAVKTMEGAVRSSIEEIFRRWEAGELTNQSVRYDLERVIRTAYRDAAAIGVAEMSAQAGIPGWRPTGVFRTPYLSGLLDDVRRNLRAYKASDGSDVARRRAVSRIEHSAGVAATRGYTDAVIECARELADFGYRLRKVWIANYVDNTPCPYCGALHGTSVGLDESFPTKGDSLGVYMDLKGPPRHPRCKCRIVILLVRFDNFFDRFDIDNPAPSEPSITTDEVQSMPKKLFDFFTRGLRRVIRFLRGA